MKQKILAVSGIKNSGKTTLIEKLIPLLASRGIRCAVIKHDGHSFAADREGTDTGKALAAGAYGTAVFDGEKFQVVKKTPVTEKELIRFFPEADLILLEGFKHSSYSKIRVIREANEEASREPARGETGEKWPSVIALVTDGSFRIPEVPAFSFDEREKIADFIYGWMMKPE